MAFNIVLVEPEIPPNTGNIARTCAATNTKLHLIEPLGFSTDDRQLKRAGLDYWKYVDISVYKSIAEFMELHKGSPMYFASTKGTKLYTEVAYEDGCFILFGKETEGLPESLLKDNKDRTVRIPMNSETSTRSLNLANSANIILFEALRQTGFKNMR